MSAPSTACELLQLISAMQWPRGSILDFGESIQTLLDALERAYRTSGKQAQRYSHRLQLKDIDWGEQELKRFQKCKAALRNRVIPAHRDKSKWLCL